MKKCTKNHTETKNMSEIHNATNPPLCDQLRNSFFSSIAKPKQIFRNRVDPRTSAPATESQRSVQDHIIVAIQCSFTKLNGTRHKIHSLTHVPLRITDYCDLESNKNIRLEIPVTGTQSKLIF